MRDVRFNDRMRDALESRLFDSWTVDAACRGIELAGRLYRDAFTDEVGQQQDINDYRWPQRTVDALKTCSGCPVKLDCLKAEFSDNPTPRHFGVRGGTPGRIREALGFKPCLDCDGKGHTTRLEVDGTVIRWAHYSDAFDASTPGFPCRRCGATGKVADPNRIERLTAWAEEFSQKRGWSVLDRTRKVGT